MKLDPNHKNKFTTSPPEEGDCCDACGCERAATTINHEELFSHNYGLIILCKRCAHDMMVRLGEAIIKRGTTSVKHVGEV